MPHVSFILVGTQSDRRDKNGAGLVRDAEAQRMAKDLGAIKYIECSALSREGLRDVFVQAILTVLDPKSAGRIKRKENRKCSIF